MQNMLLQYPPCDYVFHIIRKLNFELRNWIKKRHIKSFYVAIANPSFRAGTQCLFQLGGLGRLKPNIVMIGFKQNWASDSLEATNQYFGLIQYAFAQHSICENQTLFSEMPLIVL